MSDLFVDSWGTGSRVVLVHGSLATGGEEWQAQRPLADEGFHLLVLDRRGYGKSPAAEGEDFLRDATTSPSSWAIVRTSWVILTGGSACSSPLPAVRMRSVAWYQLLIQAGNAVFEIEHWSRKLPP